jgi:hypothetical protein
MSHRHRIPPAMRMRYMSQVSHISWYRRQRMHIVYASQLPSWHDMYARLAYVSRGLCDIVQLFHDAYAMYILYRIHIAAQATCMRCIACVSQKAICMRRIAYTSQRLRRVCDVSHVYLRRRYVCDASHIHRSDCDVYTMYRMCNAALTICMRCIACVSQKAICMRRIAYTSQRLRRVYDVSHV